MGWVIVTGGMADQPPARSPSLLSRFLRACSGGARPATPPPAVGETQRKFGVPGRLSRAIVFSLLSAFALNVMPASVQACIAEQEPLCMHALPFPDAPEAVPVVAPTPTSVPAPQVADARNPDEAGPSRLWRADKSILIIGEQHTAAAQSTIILRDLPYLKAQGMTTFAMEIPQVSAKAMGQFTDGKIDKDGLARSLWESGYDQLPEGFRMKLDMAEWAREHGVRVVCVDADRGLSYECASAQVQAFRNGIKGPIDPNGIKDVERRGVMDRHSYMSGAQAAQEGWKLWIYGRSRAMARNLAADHEANKGKTVFLVGGCHTGLAGYRQFMQDGGADLRTTPDEGVEDLLPAELKAQTQTVLFVGGMGYTGRLEQLPKQVALHPVESQLIARGLGQRTVSIAKLAGLGGVDSVIFLPLVDNNPRVALTNPGAAPAAGPTTSLASATPGLEP